MSDNFAGGVKYLDLDNLMVGRIVFIDQTEA